MLLVRQGEDMTDTAPTVGACYDPDLLETDA